jgi:hypothetical protein
MRWPDNARQANDRTAQGGLPAQEPSRPLAIPEDNRRKERMMTETQLIFTLALATLVLVLAVGIWQKLRTDRAQRTNEHSDLTDAGTHGDRRR